MQQCRLNLSFQLSMKVLCRLGAGVVDGEVGEIEVLEIIILVQIMGHLEVLTHLVGMVKS